MSLLPDDDMTQRVVYILLEERLSSACTAASKKQANLVPKSPETSEVCKSNDELACNQIWGAFSMVTEWHETGANYCQWGVFLWEFGTES